MKLRNKKTGEIPNKIETITYIQWSKKIMMVYINNDGERILNYYDSLEAFKEEWEDYEEPETYYYISDLGNIESLTNDHGQNLPEEIWHKAIKRRKEIGNYFETKEEAEKAVEKLKTWQRLKNKGFRFNRWKEALLRPNSSCIAITGIMKCDDEARKDLDLLFGGEE